MIRNGQRERARRTPVARLLVWVVLLLVAASPLGNPGPTRAEPAARAAPSALDWAVAIDPLRCPVERASGLYAACLARVPADQEPIAPDGTWWRLRFADRARAAEWVARLLQSPGVRYLEPAVQLTYQWMPSEPLVAQQSWLTVSGFPRAWDDTIGRADVVVAVIDSGVAASHPDLAGKLLPGYDYLHRDDDPDDEAGHGTAVAGIIAAAVNGQGIAGGAPGVRLLPLKVGDQIGASSFLIAEAVYGAMERGAQVINLSLGADTPSAALEHAIEQAYEQGIVVVAAAGNSPDAVTFPASYPEVIAVGGATADGKRLASFTSRLTRVDLVAPAENVLTTSWDGQEPGWQPRTGTSFAAPIVSAAAALVRSVAPDSSVEWVRQALRETAQPLDPPGQPGAGSGLLSASGAVERAVVRRFAQAWQRADLPVAAGQATRSWVWGPSAFALGREPYQETRAGTRAVAYFDKARLELTDPDRPPSDPWAVTSGLLAKELSTGLMQVGDATFVRLQPATVPVAGDPDDPTGPTYATLATVLAAPPLDEGEPVVQTIDRAGRIGSEERLAQYGVRAGPLVPETGHRIASVFWDFLQRRDTVYADGAFQTDQLFSPLFAVTGFPITEAYWTRAKVGGVERDVLVQCFERRCLTYTPDNPPGWRVEFGNVGQHYYRWRYGRLPDRPPASDPAAMAPVDGSGHH
ncbi:S8 family serine peptidase [Thermomicrobium sp. 4228-Ro]|uniref:S8 family peptidase n=1 Tax=Thermomicrobium sp. 4228-Ro TaxID=2993937 RepID=UPI002248805F|nr:S8 family serine peptidase [Thermomicrobium sp. 4228-Ro]MCX2728096.1 S8 family serine peptidase [Thermomicrobium sp. 4228-Ro]